MLAPALPAAGTGQLRDTRQQRAEIVSLASSARSVLFKDVTHASRRNTSLRGPNYQPVEQLAGLRAVRGIIVIRRCDATKRPSHVAWRFGRAIARTLALSRQAVPTLDRASCRP